ncbi:unnamed protein product, partial [Allacma fusca]
IVWRNKCAVSWRLTAVTASKRKLDFLRLLTYQINTLLKVQSTLH